jgi:hypothetical protein
MLNLRNRSAQRLNAYVHIRQGCRIDVRALIKQATRRAHFAAIVDRNGADQLLIQ